MMQLFNFKLYLFYQLWKWLNLHLHLQFLSIHLNFEVQTTFLGFGKFLLVSFWLAIEFDEFLFHWDIIVDFDVVDNSLVLGGEFVGNGQFLVVDPLGQFLFHIIVLFL